VVAETVVESPARAVEVDAGVEGPHDEGRVGGLRREAELRRAGREARTRGGPEGERTNGRAAEGVGDCVEEVREDPGAFVVGLEVDEESPVFDDAQDGERARAVPAVEQPPDAVGRAGPGAVPPVQDGPRPVRAPAGPRVQDLGERVVPGPEALAGLDPEEAAPEPREVLLKLLRGASAEAWRTLFDANVRRAPAWPGSEKALDFDTLLARTVAEGPGTLFLVPDEFFPLSPLLEEPIARDFGRWNKAAEILLEGTLKDAQRQDLFQNAGRGDFWQRYPAIVGAQMTDGLLRLAGREKFLAALAAGPRAVAALYVAATKGKGYPEFSKPVKKALEVRPSAAAGKP